jgi:hypothetical protein
MSTTVVPPTPAATILAGIIFPIVGGALVALRFYSKHVKRSGFEIEDWLTLPAFVCTCARHTRAELLMAAPDIHTWHVLLPRIW